jgi:hypothetical protein
MNTIGSVQLEFFCALTLDTAGDTCSGNTRGGVAFGGAARGGSALVDQRQHEAPGGGGTLSNYEFATTALAEVTPNACRFTLIARRVSVESAGLGILLLSV